MHSFEFEDMHSLVQKRHKIDPIDTILISRLHVFNLFCKFLVLIHGVECTIDFVLYHSLSEYYSSKHMAVLADASGQFHPTLLVYYPVLALT